MNESTDATPSPAQYSPDGRWYWNGVEWLAVAATVPATSRSRGWTIGSTIITLIALAFVFAGWVLLTATMPADISALGGLFGLVALAVGIVMVIVVIVTAVTPAKS